MSIINDALKKVQASFLKPKVETKTPAGITDLPASPPGTDAAAHSAPSQTVSTAAASGKGSSNLVVSIVTLLMLAGSILFFYTQLGHYWPQIRSTFSLPSSVRIQKITMPTLPKLPFNSASKAAPSNSDGPLAKIAVSTTTDPSAAPARTPATLNIQGIMSQDGSNLALIDNKIYEPGDVINGIKILRIATGELTILRDGQEEIIKVRR